MHKKLWRIIKDNTPSAPSEEWVEKDEQALSLIGLNIDPTLIHHICNKITAKEAWKEMSSTFGPRAKNQEVHLKIAFYGIKMNFNESIAQHVRTIKSLIAQLDGIDIKIGEKDVIAMLLVSMPKQYEGIVDTLSNLLAPTLEGCISSLLLKERELKGTTTSVEPQQQTFYNKSNVKCHHCGRKGHFQSECRFKDKPKCNNCKQLGHVEENRRYKNKANYMAAPNEGGGEQLF